MELRYLCWAQTKWMYCVYFC